MATGKKLIQEGGKVVAKNKNVLSLWPETVSTALNPHTSPVVAGPSSATLKVAPYVPNSSGPAYGAHKPIPIEAAIAEFRKDGHEKWQNPGVGVEETKSDTLVDSLLSSTENKTNDDFDLLESLLRDSPTGEPLSIEQITTILEKYTILKHKTITWLITNPSQKEKDLVIKANQKIKKFLVDCSNELPEKVNTSKLDDNDDNDLLESLLSGSLTGEPLSIEQITTILEKYTILKHKTIAWLITKPPQKEKDLVIKANQKIEKFLEYCSKRLPEKVSTSKLGDDAAKKLSSKEFYEYLKFTKTLATWTYFLYHAPTGFIRSYYEDCGLPVPSYYQSSDIEVRSFAESVGEEVYSAFKITKEGLNGEVDYSDAVMEAFSHIVS